MHQTLPRRILVLSGSRAWAHTAVTPWLAQHAAEEVVWLGDHLPAGLALPHLARREQLLGDEYTIAVLDAWAGFDPELFGAVSGTVRGGGVLILLLPPAAEWLDYPDPAKQRIALWPYTPETMPNRFIARALRILRSSPAVEWCEEGTPLPAALALSSTPPAPQPSRSSDQQQAIAALHHVVRGHRRRPLVLIADRGRGKSAALGFAAAELMHEGLVKIIVTAPHRNAVNALFLHATAIGAEAPHTQSTHTASSPALEFIPPDELLRTPRTCDLLLVDEAAAIPAPLLAQLLHHYPRIVFATTVHGYEGSGHGFALRFFKVLDRETPGWQRLELNEPIRWRDNDPLEALTHQLLLLDAEPAAQEAVSTATVESARYECLAADQLLHNEALLHELFGLLVLAHYRTSPLDLRQLLDSPNVTLHLLRHKEHVVATAITLREGGFDAELSREIYLGRRRPRGHLAAQALAFYCGMEQAPQLFTERIMRIAVHPSLQQQGLGSALLAHIAATAQRNGCDYLSASFGATPQLLRFWRRAALLPLRLGMAREASSGHHSALLMRPFTAAAQRLFARARQRFINYLPLQLGDPLRELDTALVVELLDGEMREASAALDGDDWRDLHSFCFGKRGYEVCVGAIHKLVTLAVHNPLLREGVSTEELRLLVSKVIQQHPWSAVVALCNKQGEREAVEQMRHAVRLILCNCRGI